MFNFLAFFGARFKSFVIPFLALSIVRSSKIPPSAIIKATSAAAKISFVKIAAVIAIEIKREAVNFLFKNKFFKP